MGISTESCKQTLNKMNRSQCKNALEISANKKKHDKASVKPQHTAIPPTVAIAIMVLHLEPFFEYGQTHHTYV